MSYYIILYCYACFSSFIEVTTAKRVRLFLFLFFVGTVFVLAYRGLHGVDTENYLIFFHELDSKKALDHDLDFGFYYLSSIIKWIGDSEVFYFLCIAILSIGLKIKLLSKLSPLPMFGIFVLLGAYFLSLETNQIRQALALAVCLYSMLYVIKKKRAHFIISMIIASSFHVSALIFIPVWWLYDLKISTRTLLLILGISFLLVFISLVEVFQFGVKFTFLWGDFIHSKLLNYAAKMEKVGFSFIQLWYLFTSILFIYFRKQMKDPTYSFLLNIFVLGVAMNFFLNSFSYMIRITYYFLATEGILLSMVLFKCKKLTARIMIFMIVAILIAFKNYKYYTSNIEFFQ